MALNLLVESISRLRSAKWPTSKVLLHAGAAAGNKILFVSRSNQHKLQVTCHRCTTTLFVIAQLAEMGCANGLHLNKIVIFEVGLSDLDDSFQRSFNRSSKNKTEC